MMRDLTRGLEVVLPDGRVWDGLRALRKDNTGYNLTQLFVGSEGTLGVITAAVLKLFPATPRRATAWIALPGAAAALGVLEESLEGVLGEAFERGLVTDAVLAGSPAQRQSLWALREGISEAQNHEGPSLKHDVAVPIRALPDSLDLLVQWARSASPHRLIM